MFGLLLIIASLLSAEIPQRTFEFSMEPIDVVIPCAPKDARCLEPCIEGIRKYGKEVRRVIVISREKLTDSAEWFSEDRFPFSKEEIALECFRGDEEAAQKWLHEPHSRIGWLLQQFLKLYAPFVIPDISPNVLVLDADVVFLNPVSFRNEKGAPYFTPSTEVYHAPYFAHAARLLDGLERVHVQHSGVAHHMLFQRPILEDLFQLIEEQHQVEAWKAFCRAIDLKEIYFSSMSEYEIYFNFALLRSEQVAIRPLRWTLVHSLRITPGFKSAGYAYVCYPTWLAP